jgi:hypothetical protein
VRPVSRLEPLGIRPLDPGSDPASYLELYRVARSLRDARIQVVGLLPATPDVAVTGLAVQLGWVLGGIAEGPVCVVDANTSRPALGAVVAEAERVDQRGREFVTTWIADCVTLVTPARASRGPPDLGALEALVREVRRRYAHGLVDLSGFAEAGVHLDAVAWVDGALTVARTGQTTERELRRATGRSLGVLLVD